MIKIEIDTEKAQEILDRVSEGMKEHENIVADSIWTIFDKVVEDLRMGAEIDRTYVKAGKEKIRWHFDDYTHRLVITDTSEDTCDLYLGENAQWGDEE